jgi:hypothetical protein
MKQLFLISLLSSLGLIVRAQQTFLFPDTLRNKNTPVMNDSSDKIPNTAWVRQQTSSANYIDNQKAGPQTANYYISNSNTNATTGGQVADNFNNFLWNSNVSVTSGALFGAEWNNTTNSINLGGGGTQTIGNTVLLTNSFNRLILTSTASTGSAMDLTAVGGSPLAVSALSTQVYLPNVAHSDTNTVSDVASLVLNSAYQDPSTTNSVEAINFYQLLIEPSTENILTANALQNTYAIYQAGTADTNVFKGPLNYSNKYSSSGTPSPSASTGAGSGASASITGTNDGGVLTVITAGFPSSGSTVVNVSFSSFSFPNGCSVVLFPATQSAAALSGATAVYVTGTTTGWTVTSGSTALSTSTTYKWNYQVSGY